MIEDYVFEDSTRKLLEIFENGADGLERGIPQTLVASNCASQLREMDEDEKAMVIIDLLVLTSTLNSVILELQVKGMEL